MNDNLTPGTGSADRPPTEAEEKAAERHEDIDESVSETYEEAIKTGANVKGEGEIIPED